MWFVYKFRSLEYLWSTCSSQKLKIATDCSSIANVTTPTEQWLCEERHTVDSLLSHTCWAVDIAHQWFKIFYTMWSECCKLCQFHSFTSCSVTYLTPLCVLHVRENHCTPSLRKTSSFYFLNMSVKNSDVNNFQQSVCCKKFDTICPPQLYEEVQLWFCQKVKQ